MRFPIVRILLAVLAVAIASATANATVFLKADFDDKLVGRPIGLGGASLGEPVSRSGVADTVRAAMMPTPCLDIMDNSLTTAGSVRFEFLGSQEITTGSVVISMNLWFPMYEQFFIYIREQGTSAKTFLNLRFADAGTVSCSDSNSDNGVIGTYETGRHYRVWIFFNMDGGFYSVYLDGAPAILTESHGITDRGVGAVLLGCSYDTDRDGRFYVDDLSVTDYYPSIHHLRANFNYKTVDAPIDVNGPEFGEPVFVSPIIISAIVRDEPTYTPSLEICDTDNYAGGSVRFEFLYDAEVTSGVLVIGAHLWFAEIDEYWLMVREHGTAAMMFTDLFFDDSGWVGALDSTGHVEWICPYEAGRAIPVMIVHNLDAGTYDIWIDGVLGVNDMTHGIVGRGIGSVLFGTGNDPDVQGCFYVDNVWAATLTPPQMAVCCRDTDCGLMIPMDCAYNIGDFHADLHTCLPNPCGVNRADDSALERAERILEVIPNPSVGTDVLVVYGLGRAGQLRLDVFDVAGQHVRTLFGGHSETGAGSVRWDGRGDAGHRVGPGVYFVRLASTEAPETARMVVLQ